MSSIRAEQSVKCRAFATESPTGKEMTEFPEQVGCEMHKQGGAQDKGKAVPVFVMPLDSVTSDDVEYCEWKESDGREPQGIEERGSGRRYDGRTLGPGREGPAQPGITIAVATPHYPENSQNMLKTFALFNFMHINLKNQSKYENILN